MIMKSENKKTRENKYGLIIQFVLVFLVLVLLILTAFDKLYLVIAQIVAGCALLVTSYNNYTVYNRKNLTIVYVLFGLFVLINGALELING